MFLTFLLLNTLKEVHDCVYLHLISWQHLAYRCQLSGAKLFKLRPKHHSLDHLASQICRTRLNARKLMSCWNDESFLGYLKQIGIRCHSMSIMHRLYDRYVLFLSLRWQNAKASHQGRGKWKTELPHLGPRRAETIAGSPSLECMWLTFFIAITISNKMKSKKVKGWSSKIRNKP